MKMLKLSTLIAILLISFSPLYVQAESNMFSYARVETYCSYIRSNDLPISETVTRIHKLFLEAKSHGSTKKQFTQKYFFNIGCNSQSAISYSADNDLDDVIALTEYGINLNKPYKTYFGKTITLKDYVLYKFKNTGGGDRTKFRRIYKYLVKMKIKNCAEQPELTCTATKYLPK